MSNDRNSENIFLEGFKQVLCQKKKEVAFILFERTRLKKKQHKKKSETKKRRSNKKKFYKKG